MDTSRWGPPYWDAMFSIAFNYSPDDSEKQHNPNDYANYFYYVAQTLPCKWCRLSFNQYWEELPIQHFLYQPNDTVEDRGLFYWLYLMKNKVNDKLRSQGLCQKDDSPFEAIFRKYANWQANCSKQRTCRIPNFKNRCQAQTHRGRQCIRHQTTGGGGHYCQQHKNCQSKTKKSRSSK